MEPASQQEALGFVSRWGDDELDGKDKRWVWIPGFILQNYHHFTVNGEAVGLTSLEFQVMCHIMSFKYDSATGEARPSLSTVAEEIGVTLRTVRRAVSSMRAKGAVAVTETPGKPSDYNFGELVRQCRLLAAGSTPDKIVPGPTPDKTVRGGRTKLSGVGRTKLSDEDPDPKSQKKNRSARRAHAALKPSKVRKCPGDYQGVLVAVSYAITGTHAVSTRFGQIASWLAGGEQKIGGEVIPGLAPFATPEEVLEFRAWYDDTHYDADGTPLPMIRKLDGWREYFPEFRAAAVWRERYARRRAELGRTNQRAPANRSPVAAQINEAFALAAGGRNGRS